MIPTAYHFIENMTRREDRARLCYGNSIDTLNSVNQFDVPFCMTKLILNHKRHNATNRIRQSMASKAAGANERRASAAKRGRNDKKHGPSSPDQVVRALIDGLRSGRYVPGQRLIEADLTSELKLSRGPVREALKRLSAEGLVSLIPHRGAYIRKLTRREVHDILVIQESLTGLAARIATEHIEENDNRKTFEAEFTRLMKFQDGHDTMAFLEERSRFYRTLVMIGGNQELTRFVPTMQLHLLRMQFQQHLTPGDRKRQFKEYETLAACILGDKAGKAETLMRQHVRRTRLSIERLPDEAFAEEH
jgi:DNA-binding GntR family transcriptional regulator